MEFFVYSRQAIEALPGHDAPHIIISITLASFDQAKLKETEHTKGILRQSFWDLDRVVDDTVTEEQLFSDAQADELVAFVKEHLPTIRRIIVHCDGGMSRSPGVAAALSKALTGDDAYYFAGGKRPNMRCYRKTLEACARAGLLSEPA